MSIWSKLFNDPMKPLSEAIIKVVRQDGFGISGYIDQDDHQPVLQLCKLEFFYFYLSLVEHIARSKFDSRQFSSFSSKLKSTLTLQVIDSILCPVGLPSHRRAGYARLRKPFIDSVDSKTEPYRIAHKLEELSKDEIPHIGIPLQTLALRMAGLSGNTRDERFELFYAGLINLVSYDLAHLDLERLVEAAMK